jgi:hypothetical protein
MKRFYFLFFILFCLNLYAQETTDTTQSDSTNTGAQDSTQVKQGAIKLFLDKIEVMGHIEKPQAVFIIPGNDPEIDDIQIQRSFFKEIFRPVEKKGRIIEKSSEGKKDRKDYIPW